MEKDNFANNISAKRGLVLKLVGIASITIIIFFIVISVVFKKEEQEKTPISNNIIEVDKRAEDIPNIDAAERMRLSKDQEKIVQSLRDIQEQNDKKFKDILEAVKQSNESLEHKVVELEQKNYELEEKLDESQSKNAGQNNFAYHDTDEGEVGEAVTIHEINLEQDQKIRQVGESIPAGTVVLGVLNTGGNFSTASENRSSPDTLTIKLTNNGVTPNGKKIKLKGCVVIAAGYADFATERLVVRTEKISCVKENGKIVATNINGFVQDMGKRGIAGRLVDKSGKYLTKQAISVIASGAAQSFSSRPKVYNPFSSNEDEYGADSYADRFASGMGESTSKGLQSYSDYNAKRAAEIPAYLDISPGKRIEIEFTHEAEIGSQVNLKGHFNKTRNVINEGEK